VNLAAKCEKNELLFYPFPFGDADTPCLRLTLALVRYYNQHFQQYGGCTMLKIVIFWIIFYVQIFVIYFYGTYKFMARK